MVAVVTFVVNGWILCRCRRPLRVSSQSPLVIVPWKPSTGRSNEENWNDLNLSLLKDRDRFSATAAENCFGGFQGDLLHYGFPELIRDKQVRNSRGLSPVSLSFGSPAAVDPVTHLSLSCVPSPPTSLPPHTINKRVSKNAAVSEDKRRKQLMKNRESADRSRARKQAYRKELENEVAYLREENARLRSQQQKIWSAVSVPTYQDCRLNHPLPQKKHELHKTMTAPLLRRGSIPFPLFLFFLSLSLLFFLCICVFYPYYICLDHTINHCLRVLLIVMINDFTTYL